jgi:hypothetical protein
VYVGHVYVAHDETTKARAANKTNTDFFIVKKIKSFRLINGSNMGNITTRHLQKPLLTLHTNEKFLLCLLKSPEQKAIDDGLYHSHQSERKAKPC